METEKNNIEKDYKKKLIFIKKTLDTIRDYDLASAVRFLQQLTESELLKNNDSELYTHNDLHFKTFGNIHFRSTVGYAHPAVALNHVELRTSQKAVLQPILWVNFIGIAGIQGPLALAYTERVFRNIRHKDHALASFLDIFNHRFIQLTYKIQQWIPGYSLLKPENSGIGKIIKSIDGIDDQTQLSLPKDLLRYFITYKVLFWKKIRSSAVLQQILHNFFQVKVYIQEFQGQFLKLSPQEITHIGKEKGQFYTLGHDTFLGTRIWKQNKGIDITLKDLTAETYETFNKYNDGENYKHLHQLCSCYLPISMKIRYFVQIQGHHQKKIILGEKHHLGFNTWLGTSKQSLPLKLYDES